MHKVIPRLLLLSLIVAPAGVFAQANSVPSQPHLLVKGEAKREVIPDRFTLKVALSSSDTSPGAARQRVQDNATRVLNLFERHGALENSVQATSLSIEPKTRYKEDEDEPVFTGTEVSRDLSATFAQLAQVRAVLGELKTSPEVQVSGIDPKYADEGKVRAELKRQAAEQTRVSAHHLAEAYGTRITGLYTISDVAPQFAYGVQAGHWGGGTSEGHHLPRAQAPLDAISVTGARAESLEAGSITLTENIYAIFLIAP